MNNSNIPSEMPSPNGDPVNMNTNKEKANKLAKNDIVRGIATQPQQINNNTFKNNNNNNNNNICMEINENENENNNKNIENKDNTNNEIQQINTNNTKHKCDNLPKIIDIENKIENNLDIMMKNTNDENIIHIIENNNNIKNINNNINNIDKKTHLQTQQTANSTDNNENNKNHSMDSENDESFNNNIAKRKYMMNKRRNRVKKKKNKKRCAALDYLSDSPKKKRGRKVKDKKNLPPIQKQPFFLVFPDLRLKCPQCDHIAICQGTLVQHLRTHPTSRKCPECAKIFSTQQNLIKHARLHTGERPYPCPIAKCKWAYKQKGDLLAHIQRGKHGTSSDNNRKPPPRKFYHGSTKLPTLHAISKQDVMAAPDLKQLIVALRKREEMKKKQKEKVKQKRKNQLDDFVLSMFLSIYDIDNHEMKNLLKIAKAKYGEKMLKKQMKFKMEHNMHKNMNEMNRNMNNTNTHQHNNTNNNENIIEMEDKSESVQYQSSDDTQSQSIDSIDNMHKQEQYLKIDTLPNGKKVNIKFKYLVNRVYGDYSIVLVPVHSVPMDEIYENTPEIVIDPKLIPALQDDDSNSVYPTIKQELLNSINTNSWTPNDCIAPPMKKQKLNNGQSNIKELSEHHIVLAKSNGSLGRAIGHMPRKRQYHKYNQTCEGYWQCDAPNCGSLFLSKELLEKHCKELHDSGYYGCKYCERIYRSQKNVQNHLKKAHQKHGDEYLNALIYNKFNQIIKIKKGIWDCMKNKHKNKNKDTDTENTNTNSNPTPQLSLPNINDTIAEQQEILTKSIIIKTHPIDNTILRLEHDSEKEDSDGDDNMNNKQVRCKLVPWTMQDKNKKTGRGRGRPRRITIKDEKNIKTNNNNTNNNNTTTPKKRGRPRGRPKGSKNKNKKATKPLLKNTNANGLPKRRPGRPKGSTNKKKKTITNTNTTTTTTTKRGRPRKIKQMSVSESENESSEESTGTADYVSESSMDDTDIEYELSISDYEKGTIYDDLESEFEENQSDASIIANEKSILAQDIKLNKYMKERSQKKMRKRNRKRMRIRKRGRKRKRHEISSDNNESDSDSDNDENDYIMTDNMKMNMNMKKNKTRIKIEPRNNMIRIKNEMCMDDMIRLPNFNVPNIANLGMTCTFGDLNSIPSIQNLFGTGGQTHKQQHVNDTYLNSLGINNVNNTLDIPMPAMPSLNTTTAELTGLLNQIQSAPNNNNNNNSQLNISNIGNIDNMDMNSIIESLLSGSSQRNQSAPSDTAQSIQSAYNAAAVAALSPINSMNSYGAMNGIANMNAIPINQSLSQLSAVSNQLNNIQNSMSVQRQRQHSMKAFNNLLTNQSNNNSSTHSSEEPIHPISKSRKHNNNQNKNKNVNNNNKSDPLRSFIQSGAMLNNYGNIVNNNYLLKKLNNTNANGKQSQQQLQIKQKEKPQVNNNNNRNENKECMEDKNSNNSKDNSGSPFVPPLVEAVCGAAGCTRTKRDDGKPLLMCGRCFNIKYCSKRCQLAHIHDHRQICKKKGSHKQ